MELNLVIEGALTTIFDLINDFTKNINGWAQSVFNIVTLDADQLIENFYANSPVPEAIKNFVAELIRLAIGDTTLLSFIFSVSVTGYILIQIAKWITDVIN